MLCFVNQTLPLNLSKIFFSQVLLSYWLHLPFVFMSSTECSGSRLNVKPRVNSASLSLLRTQVEFTDPLKDYCLASVGTFGPHIDWSECCTRASESECVKDLHAMIAVFSREIVFFFSVNSAQRAQTLEADHYRFVLAAVLVPVFCCCLWPGRVPDRSQ